LKDVKNKNDFIQRFDEIFDDSLITDISKSKIEDWGEVGWRGIMLDRGVLWIDDDAKIMTVNYQSSKEQLLLADAIKADKKTLPDSLQNFENPKYLIVTKNYRIRIDEKSWQKYRYASWKKNNKGKSPDIVLENGDLEFLGSGGNHTITFKNNEYTYVIWINDMRSEDDAEVTLEVLKGEKEILMDKGDIIRN
jgi:hypothetical protein